MSYKEEIIKQLAGVPHELCTAFAARSALRVLPLLAVNEKKGHTFVFICDKPSNPDELDKSLIQ